MARSHNLVGGAAALLIAATVAACSSSKDVFKQEATDPLFQSYVSLGNSITSGYQGGGINETTQMQAYPVLFASPAVANTRFAVPRLTLPGCPPPVDSFPSRRNGGNAYPPCALRDPTSVTGIINNVAVPGAATIDPTGASTANSNFLTNLFLGGATQVQRALQANPTFVSAWIGNNDILAAALSGLLVPTAGYSPGVTSQTLFVANYNKMISQLVTSPTLKGGALFAVVDVTNAPLLFHANLLNLSTDVRGAFEAAAGTAVVVDASCDNPIPLISFEMVSYINSPTNPTGPLPPIIICKRGTYPAPVGDLFVLDSVEVPAVQAAVAAYNTYIQAKADTLHWAYVDVNPTLAALRASGDIPAFPNLLDPFNTFGDYFTLDGVHPSALAHKAITNVMIDAVNAQYGTSLTHVPVP